MPALAALATIAVVWLVWGLSGTPPPPPPEAASPEALWQWIREHPDQVAIYAVAVGPGGEALPASSSFLHRAEDEVVVGSVGLIPTAAAWAELTSAHRLVPLTDWEQWWIPGVDGWAHTDAIGQLGIAPREPVDVLERDIVRAWAQHGDDAAADWLVARVPSEALEAWCQRMAVVCPRPVSSRLGRALAVSNHAEGASVVGSSSRSLADRYRSDESFRVAEVERRSRGAEAPAWALQRVGVAEGSLRMQPSELGRALVRAGTAAGEPGQRFTEALGWADAHATVSERFHRLVSVGDARPGLIVEAAWAVPVNPSPARVVVLVMEGLDESTWTGVLQTQSHRRLVARWLEDSANVAAAADEFQSEPGGDRTRTSGGQR